MSKVLLIKPRLLNVEYTGITQPLGLIYIGATLRKAGHDPRIHDCALDHQDLHILKRILENWKPDFIGVSIIITELEQTEKIMKLVRTMLPDVPVTFGGPWPTANPEKALRSYGADFVVLGEGEKVFPELINALDKGLPTASIPGTASLLNGGAKINPTLYLTEDEMNAMPLPAWDLLDHKLYARMHSMDCVGFRPYMTMITSRGCPYRCAYCHHTMGKNFRKRSVESVLGEMEELRFKYGFKDFEIVDDCFNLDRERMLKILHGIKKRLGDVKLYFPNGVRADMLEPEDIALLKQAGAVSMCFAIETSSSRLQKLIHKNLNVEKAARTITEAVDNGIYTTGFFMVGFPTETFEEASATIDFAIRLPLHRAYFFNPKPFAGTELSDMVQNILKDRNSNIELFDNSYFISSVNISSMSDNEMQMLFQSAYRRFYISPQRIMRNVLRHPRFFSLPRYAFIALLKMLSLKFNAG